MAPDLNSVPPSPRNSRLASTSRVTEPMAPPPAPSPSIPTQSVRESTGSTASGLGSLVGDNTGVGLGPGPLRHPRPLTAADLHMQLEKEQEAVVNRLTRELSLLRQQSASVVSNTSSTSTGLADSTDYNANYLLSGASHPTPSRRHRSSSSLSTRSVNTNITSASGLTGISGSTVGTTGGVAGSTISGTIPIRDIAGHQSTHPRESLSRQNSVTSSRRSEAGSPSLSSSLHQSDHFPNFVPQRLSISSQHGHNQQSISPSSARSSFIPSSASTARYEEAAYHRSELEIVKRENDMLRRRIRELERSLSSRRARSDSASTNVSISQRSSGGTQGQTSGADEDSDTVKVGESAGSLGIGGGH